MSENGLARRVASGDFSVEVCARLRDGFSAWTSAKGAVSLEQCLRLPSTSAQIARNERDQHIYAAWLLTSGASTWQKSVALQAVLNKFVRYTWPDWNRNKGPRPGSSEIYGHLYNAILAMDSDPDKVPESAKQIDNIAARMSGRMS